MSWYIVPSKMEPETGTMIVDFGDTEIINKCHAIDIDGIFYVATFQALDFPEISREDIIALGIDADQIEEMIS